MSPVFQIKADFAPSGDQPRAIDQLVQGVLEGHKDQTLLGVTGSGKTFTMAQVIARSGRPALIMAHNKTLAAQLYSEMKEFLPDNAVEYFVSYYDYYQPEAYIPRSDVYIEKDSSINEQIDRMRHAATRALFERRDVVIVASVSCIYGIGDAENYSGMTLNLRVGERCNRDALLSSLTALQYQRNNVSFERGDVRVRGDTVDIFPAHYADRAWRVSLFGDEIEEMIEFDSLTGESLAKLEHVRVFANSHHITPRPALDQAMKGIKIELKDRLERLYSEQKLVEAQRLEQRTRYDLEMMQETGMCKGIENYSRWLTGRKAGDPPPTLFEYLPPDALLFVDESHVSVPQIGGMFNGDRARKTTLVEYGFRLPSALDNRPLRFEEWDALRPQTIYVSATPGALELARSEGRVAEQLIRPTGLVDPVCIVRPATTQVDDLLAECRSVTRDGFRVLVTTLTKKMAEHLTDYLTDAGLKVRYLHSDVDTLERIEILRDLRRGVFEVLVGINLLREGLDIPECALVAILDADKEGFLRSQTALIQTIGRAARNVEGRVILYADKETPSMRAALQETERRRTIQQAYNAEHGITPTSVLKLVGASLYDAVAEPDAPAFEAEILTGTALRKKVDALRKQMLAAAADLRFEEAATLRNQIQELEEAELRV